MDLKEIIFVLVRPKNSRNVGAVCRAMKTMGLHTLYIVGAPDFNRADAAIMAVHATDVLEQAQVFATLDEALRDIPLVAGTTRRKGKKRKNFSLTPEELASRLTEIKAGRVALLFGNEETGLTEDELNYCHLAVRIPSNPVFPSLNLSHAVQIIAYQLYRQLSASPIPRYTPLDNRKLTELVTVITNTLTRIGLFKSHSELELSIYFRDILARATLSGKEAQRLENIFRKIDALLTLKAANAAGTGRPDERPEPDKSGEPES